MSLFYFQRLAQPLSQLESPIESNQSEFKSEKSSDEASIHPNPPVFKEMQQINQAYHLERRLFS